MNIEYIWKLGRGNIIHRVNQKKLFIFVTKFLEEICKHLVCTTKSLVLLIHLDIKVIIINVVMVIIFCVWSLYPSCYLMSLRMSALLQRHIVVHVMICFVMFGFYMIPEATP